MKAGEKHSIALKKDGSIWRWGYDVATTILDGPVRLGIDNDWVQIDASGYHSFAIKRDGSLWAWGYNSYGQLGTSFGDKAEPEQLPSNQAWRAVFTGGFCTFAIKSDGTLWSWGINNDGNNMARGILGYGNHQPIAQVGTDNDWKEVACDAGVTLAIKNDGSLWGCGTIENSILGNINTTNGYFVQIFPEYSWKHILSGGTHVFGISSNNKVYSWGDNYYGQLGLGLPRSNQPVASPQLVDLPDMELLSLGNYMSIATRFCDSRICGTGLGVKGALANGMLYNHSYIDWSCKPNTYAARVPDHELPPDEYTHLKPKEGYALGNIFPNPAKDICTVEYIIPPDVEAKIVVLDMYKGLHLLSHDIEEQGRGKLSLNLKDFSSGLYFCSLWINGNVKEIKKLILVK